MGIRTEEVGSLSVGNGQTNVAIDTVQSLILPTALQMVKGGIMTCILSLETQNARFRFTNAPTATNGVLLMAPGILTLRGKQINTFKIIGVAAGGIINYEFTLDEVQ